MTQEYYSIITNTGLAKHAAASLGGSQINLTHLAVGDSNGIPYNPVATATALQNERYRTATTYVVVNEDNPNQIVVEAIIGEEVGPFYVREVGIFDADGDLFAIGKFPETFKPNLPTGSGKRLYVRMILGFASTPQVSLVVSSQAINNDPNFSTTVFNALAEKLAKAQNLADVEDASEARNNLGLEIGADIQAFAANLAALAGLTGATKKIPYFTAAGQMAVADLFSNKNAIINGDFNIWQRGTSFVSIVGGYSADRWRFGKAGTTGVIDISRSTDVPTFAQAGRLFNYSLLADCQTADSSVAVGDVAFIEQRIEGYNFLNLAQKQITISFWVKSTKIGSSYVFITNNGSDRSCVKEFTINASDTWEFKTVTFPASPSAGNWNYSNGIGARIGFTLMCGSNYQTAADSYANGEYYGSSNQINHYDNTSNNFKICGVQLEAGAVATLFEQRSIQAETLLCERYFKYFSYLVFRFAPNSATIVGQTFTIPVTMRTSPTGTLATFQLYQGGSGGVISDISTTSFAMWYTAAGAGYSSGDMSVKLDAEL